jgi:hypothetical protein
VKRIIKIKARGKDMNKDILNNSWEIWDFLVSRAGLDVKNYDTHIVEELCKRLNIPLPCKDIKVELQKRNISPELFIGAFLKCIQPYAQMMNGLCVFFYLHGVKKTNEEMKILFDFGKGPEDLGFDLKHFRDILWRYTRISRYVGVYGWNYKNLWDLAGIFKKFWRYTPQDTNARNWLFNYEKKGEFSLSFPSLPHIGIEEIDFWLQEIWQVWTNIILECRKYGSNRNDLKKYAKTQQRVRPKLPEEERNESYEVIGLTQELTDFKEWDSWTLSVLDSDRWPERMLKGLFGFAEKLIEIPEVNRSQEAQHIVQEIKKLFSDLPFSVSQKEMLIKEFLELLDLPIWKRRHELYQTWVLTQIDKALEDYQRTIHHVNGSLILRFSGTQVGTIETMKGRIHIWSELRSPLDNPVGKGRKGHIQPDYSLSFEPITEPSQTIVAIECKQYLKANPKNFVAALIDYARGRPNAKVILVNYGNIPNKILNQIDPNLRQRILPIGDFIPEREDSFKIFKDSLLQSIPKPVNLIDEFPFEKLQFDLIAVDISASMSEALKEIKVLWILQVIVNTSPNAKLIAIDTEVKRNWPNAKIGLSELLELPKNGSTDLKKALSNHDLSKAVILTDEDGWQQISLIRPLPFLVVVCNKGSPVVFHFRE